MLRTLSILNVILGLSERNRSGSFECFLKEYTLGALGDHITHEKILALTVWTFDLQTIKLQVP